MADQRAGLRVAQLLLPMLLFVVVGTPLTGYIWETLNRLVAGHVEPVRLAITLPAAALLAGLLVLLSRTIARWEGERVEHEAPRPSDPSTPRAP